jgi:hypothetical protein
MKFTNAAISLALVSASSVFAVPMKRAVDPALVPQFGIKAGVNPTGTGDCDGVNGIKIPCACPPDRGAFIKALNDNVNAGKAVNNPGLPAAVTFPTGNSKGDQLARIQASLITLQNLNGPGKGCPAASTTFVAQQQAIQGAPGKKRAPSPQDAGKLRTSAAGPDIATLAPALGAAAGKNPDGAGNCDGAVNGPDGKPVKVPCACPPAQDAYIAALSANVQAGQAVNNPSIKVSFPTGDSKADQLDRVNAALVTLQNLNGPGKGCPAASTTLVAQQKALS